MIQLSHSLYFTTASLGWQALGYSSFSVGAFWAWRWSPRSASSPSPTAS